MIVDTNDIRYVLAMTTFRPIVGRSGSEFTHMGLRLAAVAAAATAGIGLIRAVGADGGSLPVMLADGVQPLGRGGLPAGTSVTAVAETVQLSVASLPLDLRLAAAAEPALLMASIAVGAWCMAGVVRSVGTGQPFHRRNPARLVGVAFAILNGGLLAPLVGDAASIAVLEATGLTDAGFPFAIAATISFAPIVLTVLVLTVAEAFRRGAALVDEVDGLV